MNFLISSGRYCFALLVVILLFNPLYAQQESIEYGLESNTAVSLSSGDLPFWFYANKGGTVDQRSTNFANRFFSRYSYHNSDQSLRLNAGFDGTARLSQNNTFHFTELYGAIGYSFLNLKVGRFYDTIGMTDDNLSMGSMQVSRNATPVPKVQLETDGFTNVPYLQGYVQFKSMISHGWLEEDRYVKNAYLHQKYFFLKINYKMLEGMGGIIHNAVWGGVHPQHGELPSSFNAWKKVLLGSSASEDSNAPGADILNVIGNSVAAYDFRLNVNLDDFRFKAYRMFYLEDKVSTRFRSPWDGMWGAGIELRDQNSFINEVLWEHMNTKRQDSFDYEPRGTASYYHNSIYRGGWAYENKVLGNPLILYGSNPNFVGRGNISNNIIVAHHFGIQGRPFDRLNYKVLFTYSRNYGTVNDQTRGSTRTPLKELRIDEYSGMIQLNYSLFPEHGISLAGGLAADVGDLFGKNRLGLQLGIHWNRIKR